jgi:2-octaprenyl-6-methoxyphenol hydroxylase
MNNDYDIVIVGGGMVGASLACALAPLSLKIGIIEQFPFRSESQPSFDDRSTALAYGSRLIFEAMGLWGLISEYVTPISKIHISDRGHFGATRLDSRQLGVEALGYVIENRVLGDGLQALLSSMPNVDSICPAEVTQIDIREDAADVQILANNQARTLTASLVVAADGSQSVIRQQLGLPVKSWDYGQTALISNVGISQPHQQVAYERFTDTGPLALLPLQDSMDQGQAMARCSLVWTLRNDQVDEYLAMSDTDFLGKLQQRFGRRLGDFLRVGSRQSYPLRLIRVPEQVQARVALIGNAAHTLHPVAGQGFNLGVRDVAVLSEVLAEAVQNVTDLGDLSLLSEYAQWRRRDHRRVMAFTDGLVRIFSNPLFPVKMARGLALTALDFIPPLKKALGRHTMGLSGRVPHLRGDAVKRDG